MPFMGGMESTGIIRQYEIDEKLDNIPIIALTAHAMLGDRERVCRQSAFRILFDSDLSAPQCLESGMTDYLVKPLRKVDLQNALKTVAMGRKSVQDL